MQLLNHNLCPLCDTTEVNKYSICSLLLLYHTLYYPVTSNSVSFLLSECLDLPLNSLSVVNWRYLNLLKFLYVSRSPEWSDGARLPFARISS